MKHNRLLALGLALMMNLSCVSMAGAVEVSTSGGTGEVPIEITAEAVTFSVTVPTNIPVHVGADGSVTCPATYDPDSAPTGLSIQNHSGSAVKVSKIEVSDGSWTLTDYNNGDVSKLTKAGIDSKQLGFQLTVNPGNESKKDSAATTDSVGGKQELSYDLDKWTIPAVTTYPLECKAIASAVLTSIEEGAPETAASLVFVIDWV